MKEWRRGGEEERREKKWKLKLREKRPQRIWKAEKKPRKLNDYKTKKSEERITFGEESEEWNLLSRRNKEETKQNIQRMRLSRLPPSIPFHYVRLTFQFIINHSIIDLLFKIRLESQ